MTREEAIQELQNCKGLIQQDGQDYLDERDIPLLDMAIEALSADALLKQEIDFHKEVSRIEAEKVVDLEHKLAEAVSREFYEDAVKANIRIVMENRELKEQIESADAVQGDECDHCVHKWDLKGGAE